MLDSQDSPLFFAPDTPLSQLAQAGNCLSAELSIEQAARQFGQADHGIVLNTQQHPLGLIQAQELLSKLSQGVLQVQLKELTYPPFTHLQAEAPLYSLAHLPPDTFSQPLILIHPDGKYAGEIPVPALMRSLLDSHPNAPFLLESMSEGYLSLNRDWDCTYLNQQAIKLLGYDRTTLLGKNFWRVMPHTLEQTLRPKYEQAMHNDEKVTLDNVYYPPPKTNRTT